MRNNKCKICQRFGQKLFLKGEKCFSAKCPLTRKSYSAGKSGQSGHKRRPRVSEYGRQLMEKQKLRFFFGLKEKQLSRYVKEISKHPSQEDAAQLLMQTLESRLDHIIYRLGFADSLGQARQLVVHGHFLVNEKKVDRPSYRLKLNEVITVKPKSKNMIVFQGTAETLKKREAPVWLKVNIKKLEGEILRWPTLEEVNPPADIPTIFEFYSR